MKGKMAMFYIGALLLIPVSQAGAWGPLGHKIVARVAEGRLSPVALDRIRGIIGDGVALEDITLCADDVLYAKDPLTCGGFVLDPKEFTETRPWHYLDVPGKATPHADPLSSYCPYGKDCPISQIRLQTAVLKSPAASQRQKQIAVMFIVHFLGDIHMPLHVRPDQPDMGRNKKMLTYLGIAKNLHQLWDGLLLPEDYKVQGTMDPTPWVIRINAVINAESTTHWTQGDMVENAGWESFVISRDIIDPDYERERNLDKEYQIRMEPILEKRLAMAGVRLAAVLEDAFQPLAQDRATSQLPRRPPLRAMTRVVDGLLLGVHF
ncbi:MAG: hypothetical protein HY551_05275 [Elusimicrobia bacterium]|nr:hypothetical protein [Elusimicrobiota bacterium]